MLKPRDYQHKAMVDLYNFLCNNPGKNPVVNACVGAGKSIIIAMFCKSMIESFPNLRILNLVHTKELIGQNYEKFKSLNSNISSSVYSASLGKKSMDGQVVYGGIQSVARNDEKIHWDMILVDEVHLISKQQSKGMYRKYIDFAKSINPNVLIVGFTGTAFRLDGGSIVDGDEKLFDEICVDISIRQLLDLGFLSPLVLPDQKVRTKFDTSKVKQSNGDYKETASAAVMDGDIDLINKAVDEYMMLSQGRNHHLIFGSSIEHCYHLKESFSRYIKCEVVHGGLKGERDEIIQSFQNKDLKMIINYGILTTGFDAPHIDSIGLFRPTKSPALYVQIGGRGLRLSPGKKDCLWIDFTNTTAELGPIDDVRPPPTKDKAKKGEAPIKQCWACEQPVAVLLSECPHCGALFEMNNGGVTHNDKASTADILKKYKEPEWYNVDSVDMRRHTVKSNGNKSVKVKYTFGINSIEEWVFTNRDRHNGLFGEWWSNRCGPHPIPNDIDKIIDNKNNLSHPKRIKIDYNGENKEYGKIIEFDYSNCG